MKGRFTSLLRCLALAITAMAFTVPALAKVTVTERIKTYPITGSNGAEIARSIVKRGLRASNTNHAIASTSTSMKIVNVDSAIRRSRCVVTDVHVRLDLVYTYPHWRDRNRASPAVQRAWDKFMKRVERHEQKHGAISKDYARDIERTIRRAKGRVTNKCSDFGAAQARKMDRQTIQFQKRHERFDQRESRVFSRVRRLQRNLLEAN